MTVAKKRGFTIVELLVVITIIGILMAMLFPAINSVRVTARRGQCVNRERQLGRGILTYTTQKDRFPARLAARPDPDGSPSSNSANQIEAWCWIPFVLPFIDNTSVYDHMVHKNAAFATNIRALICPADPPATPTDPALSYVVNGGYHDVLEVDSTNPDAYWDRLERGVFFRHYSSFPGMESFWVKQSLSYITNHDGTSQTIMVSENVNTMNWTSTQDSLEQEHCIMWWDPEDWQDKNPTCKAGGQGDNMEVELDGPPECFRLASTFSPAETMGRPSSRHPGGFVVTYCDGSTRFLNAKVGWSVYNCLMTPNGFDLGQTPLNEAVLDQ